MRTPNTDPDTHAENQRPSRRLNAATVVRRLAQTWPNHTFVVDTVWQYKTLVLNVTWHDGPAGGQVREVLDSVRWLPRTRREDTLVHGGVENFAPDIRLWRDFTATAAAHAMLHRGFQPPTYVLREAVPGHADAGVEVDNNYSLGYLLSDAYADVDLTIVSAAELERAELACGMARAAADGVGSGPNRAPRQVLAWLVAHADAVNGGLLEAVLARP